MFADPAFPRERDAVEILYAMLKPPPEVTARIDGLRHRHGIPMDYERGRLHITLLPIVEVGGLPPGALERLIAIVGEVDADPFPITLDRLNGNALRVGAGAKAVVALRRAIERALARHGMNLRFDNRPHLSLAYGLPPGPAARIDPIGWMVRDIRIVGSVRGESRHIDHGTVPLIPRQEELF